MPHEFGYPPVGAEVWVWSHVDAMPVPAKFLGHNKSWCTWHYAGEPKPRKENGCQFWWKTDYECAWDVFVARCVTCGFWVEKRNANRELEAEKVLGVAAEYVRRFASAMGKDPCQVWDDASRKMRERGHKS